MRKAVTTVGLIIAIAIGVHAQSAAPIASAAQNGDREAVKALLKKGVDVNEAQGDGTTALHWAAIKGDAEMAQMLLVAGANVRATTRIGSYTALYLAAKGGYADVVAALLAAGADAKAVTANGTTPLMIAAAAGDTRSVTSLIENGADINAKETKGETPLMFAAAFNRVDAVKLLLARGADHKASTKVTDLFALTAPEEENMARQGMGRTTTRPADIAGATRAYRYNELISSQGGLTALLFAARQGYADVVNALLDAGADINQPNAGDRTTPLLMAIINGHFDLAKQLIERGANVNAAAFNGVTPLYGVLNIQWAPKSLYPSPKAYQQQTTTYLELMQALLAKGADPNARVSRKVWYQAYNSDYAGFDEAGATPFFRAAYASDVAAMKLLIANGADPHIGTFKPAGRPFTGEGTRQIQDVSGLPAIPYGGPGILPLHAATGVGYGEGFAANSHRYAPTGFMPAIKFLVEETGADVNAVDHEGNTPL
ncbi:MAG TPA: ankyrin repeat domain-containing protein, partial [Vicinamibacterales bacterium]|nr:ankyrin repeat domain-containing protein [Vicinamibacterales bacterium]